MSETDQLGCLESIAERWEVGSGLPYVGGGEVDVRSRKCVSLPSGPLTPGSRYLGVTSTKWDALMKGSDPLPAHKV